jgi:hypothetical protein
MPTGAGGIYLPHLLDAIEESREWKERDGIEMYITDAARRCGVRYV